MVQCPPSTVGRVQTIYLMDIAVDFDGTCVTHEFPAVGQEIGAAEVLRKLTARGHRLILCTMRSDRIAPRGKIKCPGIADVYGLFLTDAVNWFKDNGIPLYAIQQHPEQIEWTTSPKCYAHMYIDDAALGCPLIHGDHARPYVDWMRVENMIALMDLNIIEE